MKFAILPEHKEFFRDHHFIVFEGIAGKFPFDGRDCWRMDPEAPSQSRRLARVMADLSGETILLAFDWAITGDALVALESLDQGICFQRLVGGLLLCPDGSGIYFRSDVPFVDLNLDKGLNYFLIGYGGNKTSYVCNERDPYAHQLKKDGYVFGDRLSSKIHPILARH